MTVGLELKICIQFIKPLGKGLTFNSSAFCNISASELLFNMYKQKKKIENKDHKQIKISSKEKNVALYKFYEKCNKIGEPHCVIHFVTEGAHERFVYVLIIHRTNERKPHTSRKASFMSKMKKLKLNTLSQKKKKMITW